MKNCSDEDFMRIALDEAKRGEGYVSPNPLVGAVVVKDSSVVSTGFHKKYGEAHAEVNAISSLPDDFDYSSATIYVSLEPCSHSGKTPPCCDLIIEKGFARCVVAILDPNPLVSGRGVKKIKEAGIDVKVGVLEDEARALNQIFFKYITTKEPYVFLKCAVTLDGKIATSSGDSKWITNEVSREKVHRYRNRFSAILTGIGTVKVDNPKFSTRLPAENGVDPALFLIDFGLKVDSNANIFDLDRVYIFTNSRNAECEKMRFLANEKGVKFIFFEEDKVELKTFISEIGKHNFDSVMIEAGSSIVSQAFSEDVIDSGEIFVAPKIVGDEKSLSFARGFSPKSIKDSINLNGVEVHSYIDNAGFYFVNREY